MLGQYGYVASSWELLILDGIQFYLMGIVILYVGHDISS